jgi:3D (Asp-Asp-Asp) domain-containing protein
MNLAAIAMVFALGTSYNPKANIKIINLEVTGYTNNDEGMNGKGITKSGLQATEETIAAPQNIDLGTNIYIEGYGSKVVQDRGGMIKEKEGIYCIDIWCSTREEALQIGRRRVKGIMREELK